MVKEKYIAKARFIPAYNDIRPPLRKLVSKMTNPTLEKIAGASLSQAMRYHSCNNCLVCAAVAEAIERATFMQYEPEYVKTLIEG